MGNSQNEDLHVYPCECLVVLVIHEDFGFIDAVIARNERCDGINRESPTVSIEVSKKFQEMESIPTRQSQGEDTSFCWYDG